MQAIGIGHVTGSGAIVLLGLISVISPIDSPRLSDSSPLRLAQVFSEERWRTERYNIGRASFQLSFPGMPEKRDVQTGPNSPFSSAVVYGIGNSDDTIAYTISVTPFRPNVISIPREKWIDLAVDGIRDASHCSKITEQKTLSVPVYGREVNLSCDPELITLRIYFTDAALYSLSVTTKGIMAIMGSNSLRFFESFRPL